ASWFYSHACVCTTLSCCVSLPVFSACLDLHPFPTRRSSDLLALGIKAVFLVLALLDQATMWMAVFADMGASLLVVFNGLRLLRRSEEPRLNSSHVKNSYAVFCLKKKNIVRVYDSL